MPTQEINPIKKKLMTIIDSGLRSREEICVASRIPYPTLMNSFLRETTSRGVRLALFGAGVVTDKDLREYDIWFARYKSKRKKRKPKKNATGTATKNKNPKPKK